MTMIRRYSEKQWIVEAEQRRNRNEKRNPVKEPNWRQNLFNSEKSITENKKFKFMKYDENGKIVGTNFE